MGQARHAFTLVELLIAVAIVGLLVAILLPAINVARSAARRVQCVNNMRQLVIALNSFESAQGYYPAGSVSRRNADKPTTPHGFYRWSTLAQLTPYIEQQAAYDSLDLSVPLYGRNFQISPPNEPAVATVVPGFLCPSDLGRRVHASFGPTNYAACAGTGINGGSPHDSDGIFFTNSYVRTRQVKDGLSKTVALSESVLGREVARGTPRSEANPRYVYAFARTAPLTEQSCRNSAFWNFQDLRGFAWVNGEFRAAMYNHHWPPNSSEFDCVSALTTGPPSLIYTSYGWRTARSLHTGGVNLVMLDGAVRFVEDSIDLDIWRAMATRAGEDDSSR